MFVRQARERRRHSPRSGGCRRLEGRLSAARRCGSCPGRRSARARGGPRRRRRGRRAAPLRAAPTVSASPVRSACKEPCGGSRPETPIRDAA
ncbi:hypothetical protein CEQ11_005860 [Micrococcus sp. FDAARGOS_333]|nr:hypothetical protein CEQ11_005860 [Micrococcus sp. FDAARGOS_333]